MSTGKILFDEASLQCSKLVTLKYSTSFSLGIKTLDKEFHEAIYAIYGFVRFADEIVDTFHDKDKAKLLKRFKDDTLLAIDEKVSFNPILHAFQLVVNRYEIEMELIEAFLKSMEMDLENIDYDQKLYDTYIYGSAEVVGLMCLQVFCKGNKTLYLQLKEPARRLGAAFQKVNFLRDIKSDFEERGRVYFPGVDFNNFSAADKAKIESDIELDFAESYKGIQKLPSGAKLGVYLAYIYYIKLFNKIRSCPASRIANERIRIPDLNKFALLIQSWFKYRLNHI
jgi:phytoene synthase